MMYTDRFLLLFQRNLFFQTRTYNDQMNREAKPIKKRRRNFFTRQTDRLWKYNEMMKSKQTREREREREGKTKRKAH